MLALLRTEKAKWGPRPPPSPVGTSRAAQQAPVLLLDEPTSSLDVRHQEMVMTVAKSLAAKGACVVVIIHDHNLASA